MNGQAGDHSSVPCPPTWYTVVPCDSILNIVKWNSSGRALCEVCMSVMPYASSCKYNYRVGWPGAIRFRGIYDILFICVGITEAHGGTS